MSEGRNADIHSIELGGIQQCGVVLEGAGPKPLGSGDSPLEIRIGEACQLDIVEPLEHGQVPLRDWMLSFTREQDLALLSRIAGVDNPADPQSVPMYTLIPAFMLSELRAAFIIGFVIFVPFLVIDIVVAAALMSMGMMMLPPVMISLPFKILLFILVDGWGLILRTLLQSYGGAG